MSASQTQYVGPCEPMWVDDPSFVVKGHVCCDLQGRSKPLALGTTLEAGEQYRINIAHGRIVQLYILSTGNARQLATWSKDYTPACIDVLYQP